jgi:hypothetical protein
MGNLFGKSEFRTPKFTLGVNSKMNPSEDESGMSVVRLLHSPCYSAIVLVCYSLQASVHSSDV